MFPNEAYTLLTRGINREQLLKDVSANCPLSYKLINEDVITDKEERKILLANFTDPGHLKSLLKNNKLSKEEKTYVYNLYHDKVDIALILLEFMELTEGQIDKIIIPIIKQSYCDRWITILSNNTIMDKLLIEHKELLVNTIIKSGAANSYNMLNMKSGVNIQYGREKLLERALETGNNAYRLFTWQKYINNKERTLMLDKIMATKTYFKNILRDSPKLLTEGKLTENDITIMVNKIVEDNNLDVAAYALEYAYLNKEQKELLTPFAMMLKLTKGK